MRLDLSPHVGIGPIKLGSPKKDVRAAMATFGLPLDSERESMDFFCDASIQVEYESDGTASFIGVSSDLKLVLVYDGVDLFDTEAANVFQLFSSRDNSGHHEFSASEYVFPSQIVTLYDADTQYDRRRDETRAVWGQIGCGDSRYLDAVR